MCSIQADAPDTSYVPANIVINNPGRQRGVGTEPTAYVVTPTRTTTNYFCASEHQACQSATVTVNTPTPTTFNSFTATPASVVTGGTTVLNWSFTPGSALVGCEIVGGNWPNGYAIGANGSLGTGAISTPAPFEVNCYDNNAYGWGAWHSLTVGTLNLAPVSADASVTSPVQVGQSATISFHA
ncbi:MAG TPA: hypothetical protein VIY48_11315, partial [Candidatus Paceibacterota bacterium]